jgi:hypothetical protein
MRTPTLNLVFGMLADRPVRSAGHQPTADVIAEWGSGEDSFAKNPPNATLSVFGRFGEGCRRRAEKSELEGDKLNARPLCGHYPYSPCY